MHHVKIDMAAHMQAVNDRRTKRIEETIAGLEKMAAIIPKLLEVAHSGQEPQEALAYHDFIQALALVVEQEQV